MARHYLLPISAESLQLGCGLASGELRTRFNSRPPLVDYLVVRLYLNPMQFEKPLPARHRLCIPLHRHPVQFKLCLASVHPSLFLDSWLYRDRCGHMLIGSYKQPSEIALCCKASDLIEVSAAMI